MAKKRAEGYELPGITRLRKEFSQALFDRDQMIQGYLEQLGSTLGATMVVQESILDMLGENQGGATPTVHDRIQALVEAKRAKFKAEQEAKAKAAEEAAAKAKAEQGEPAQETPSAETETVH